MSENNNCEFCKCPDTQLHIFNICKVALDRYEWWHNSIILIICDHWKTKATSDLLQHCADIDGYVNPATLFKRRDQTITTNMDDNHRHRARPDIVLKNDNQIIATELTYLYETNTEISRESKKRRYENFKKQLITPTSNFKLILLEITSLGFTTNDAKCFKDFVLKLNLDYERIIYKCQKVATRTSFYIYCRRNKQRLNLELLSRDVATGGHRGAMPLTSNPNEKRSNCFSFKHQEYCFLDEYCCSEIIWTRNFTTFTLSATIFVQFTAAYHFS